jgi:hypothetical protein
MTGATQTQGGKEMRDATNRPTDRRQSSIRFVLALSALLTLAAAPTRADEDFHTGDNMSWTIHDMAVYQGNKAAFDLLARSVGQCDKHIKAWFSPFAPAPMRFNIRKGGCGVGLTSGTITIGDTCIIGRTTAESQNWPRRVAYFFMGYTVFHGTVPGWPYADFSDPLFKVLQADLAGELEGAAAKAAIEAEVDTEVKRQKYQYYRTIKNAHGWVPFVEALRLAKADGMDFNRIPAEPSPTRNAYVIAYLSLALKKKSGREAHAAGITALTPALVMDVLRARNLLAIADRKAAPGATASAWEAYRSGRHTEVKGLLPAPN